MKIATIKLAATALALATVVAAQAQSVQPAFRPDKSRYARGETLTIVMLVKDSAGRRMANTPVSFTEYVESTGSFREIGWGYTNAAGEATLRYRVPTDANMDNVYVGGSGLTDYGWYFKDKRIPIGL